MTETRVLIGSPIQESPHILTLFLQSLKRLEKQSTEINYCFVDDNHDPESIEQIRDLQKEYPNTSILSADCQHTSYQKNEYSHRWSEELVWKVAKFKDYIIQFALDNAYDFLFLLDSDVIVHPLTLEQLLKAEKNIIANIFWTQWQPDTLELPQVWLQDQYTLYRIERGKHLESEERRERVHQFLNMLRKPGIYEVGGVGACTLISRNAMKSGVCFEEINNISFWGEDRHFCVRAKALGFRLFVETSYPSFHIYRESMLTKAYEYFQQSDIHYSPGQN